MRCAPDVRTARGIRTAKIRVIIMEASWRNVDFPQDRMVKGRPRWYEPQTGEGTDSERPSSSPVPSRRITRCKSLPFLRCGFLLCCSVWAHAEIRHRRQHLFLLLLTWPHRILRFPKMSRHRALRARPLPLRRWDRKPEMECGQRRDNTSFKHRLFDLSSHCIHGTELCYSDRDLCRWGYHTHRDRTDCEHEVPLRGSCQRSGLECRSNTVEVSATTPAPDTQAPVFGGITGAVATGNLITLSWTAADGQCLSSSQPDLQNLSGHDKWWTELRSRYVYHQSGGYILCRSEPQSGGELLLCGARAR